MGINSIVDQAASQQMSVALSQGAANDLQNIVEKTLDKKLAGRSQVQRVLEAKNDKEVAKGVLLDLVNKMGTTGIKLNPENFTLKIQNNAKNAYDLFLNGEEDFSDSVDIRNLGFAVSGVKDAMNKRGSGSGRGMDELIDTGKIKAAIEEYSVVLVQFLVTGGSELKKKLEQLEASLRSDGLSESDLHSLRQNIKTSVRGALAAQLKEGLLKRLTSNPKSFDWNMASKEITDLCKSIEGDKKLGGFDFGGHKGNLQGVMDSENRKARAELKSFVGEELEKSLVARHLGSEKASDEIDQLIKLGKKLDFNFEGFVNNFQNKRDALGFQQAPYFGPNLNADTQSGQKRDHEEMTGYEFTQDDEKEILINQLRALYMQRALRGNWRTKVMTAFKIKKLTNGLIKLGVNFGDFENIEKEGTVLASFNAMEMLREALYERATLYEMAGPAKRLLEKRIKGVMKNLQRLGVELTAGQFNQLRDEANHKMFDTTIEELARVRIIQKTTSLPGLQKKERLLVKLLERLKEESGIQKEILNTSAIKEGA